ncbi:MAG: NAD(P)/FAD-dependent oxidoreductase [Polaromonas sp.]
MSIETDAVVIGAGPVGLFQVFQLGLLDIKCHVIDALPAPGGQCIELYPDKPIYDIPGTPRTTGRELTASLLAQIKPFNTPFHLGQVVSQIDKMPDGRFQVATSKGQQFTTQVIIIAAGVGAFQPKLLKIAGLEKFENSQLFYHSQPETTADQNVLVVGGEDSALECAIGLATQRQAQSVILLHRRDVYQAAPELIAKIHALRDAKALKLMVGQVTGFDEQAGCLSAAQVTGIDGQVLTVAADKLLVYLGLSPKLGLVADWGLAMARKQLEVDTEKFATSVPGIFAVGDINSYPGKKKLILSGFHECALAAFGAADIVYPGKNPQLEYTTSSTRLHKLLGVDGQGINTL